MLLVASLIRDIRELHCEDPALAHNTSEVAVGFLVFSYLVFHNLTQLHMHAIIFNPLQFLCILMFDVTFVQVHSLQQTVPACLIPH